MSVNITIRNVPDQVRDELAARARAAGQSLQEHLLRELVALASRPTVETVLARTRARLQRRGDRLTPEEVLAYRDADRR